MPSDSWLPVSATPIELRESVPAPPPIPPQVSDGWRSTTEAVNSWAGSWGRVPVAAATEIRHVGEPSYSFGSSENMPPIFTLYDHAGLRVCEWDSTGVFTFEKVANVKNTQDFIDLLKANLHVNGPLIEVRSPGNVNRPDSRSMNVSQWKDYSRSLEEENSRLRRLLSSVVTEAVCSQA